MDYVRAARVPEELEPQKFGMWNIIRRPAPDPVIGFETQTLLTRWNIGSLHLPMGEIVMDDSLPELRRHLPVWLRARGRVLKTGLGLGCVVRGLLINPEVEHVDVVEIDPDIVRVVGPLFDDEPRVTIHLADAHTWDFGNRRWDFVWHDIHDNTVDCSGDDLQVQHARLIMRYSDVVPTRRQGAWSMPREFKRAFGLGLR